LPLLLLALNPMNERKENQISEIQDLSSTCDMSLFLLLLLLLSLSARKKSDTHTIGKKDDDDVI
jgi:hypothetical protein